MASKKTKFGYYAVQRGRNIGIYSNWDDCEAQIKGYQGAKYKKFDSLDAAQQYAYPDTTAGSSISTIPSIPTTINGAPFSGTKGKGRTLDTHSTDTSDCLIVYSDGACKGNGKVEPIAGIGVWWGEADRRNLAERCPGDQTNNRAELIAILRVFETLPSDATKPLTIRTDSQYSINCLKDWLRGWKRNNWKTSKGDPVKNAGIIRCISLHLDIRETLGHKVSLEYVKGHSGDRGNDGADLMANIGATMPTTPERDWAALEKMLHQQMAQIEASKGPFSVVDEPIARVSPDIQKTLAQSITSISSPQPRFPKSSSSVASSSKATIATSSQSAPVSSKQPSKSKSVSVPPAIPVATAPASQPLQISQRAAQRSTAGRFDYLWNEGAKSPLQVIYPPRVLEAKDVNFDDYVDCWLDDSDLADDLSD